MKPSAVPTVEVSVNFGEKTEYKTLPLSETIKFHFTYISKDQDDQEYYNYPG